MYKLSSLRILYNIYKTAYTYYIYKLSSIYIYVKSEQSI